MVETKKCSACRAMKPIDEYRKHNRSCDKCCERGKLFYQKKKLEKQKLVSVNN